MLWWWAQGRPVCCWRVNSHGQAQGVESLYERTDMPSIIRAFAVWTS